MLDQIAYVEKHCPALACLKEVRAAVRQRPVDEVLPISKRCTRTCYLGGR